MNCLTSERILLRAVEPGDADFLYRVENDTEIWQVSNTLTPFSKHIIDQYIQNSHLDIYETKQLRLIIELKGSDPSGNKTIGTIDLFDFDPFHLRAGLGILIYEDRNRQKGYASEALKLFMDYAFGIMLLHQLWCNIAVDNDASLRLFTGQGFQICGIKKDWIRDKNKWMDEYLLQNICDGKNVR